MRPAPTFRAVCGRRKRVMSLWVRPMRRASRNFGVLYPSQGKLMRCAAVRDGLA